MKKVLGLLAGGLFMVAAMALPATAGAVTQTFNYSGGVQTWTVPYGVSSATFSRYGVQGRGFGPGATSQGGRGGLASATVLVTPNDQITVKVGGQGVANGGGLPTPGTFNVTGTATSRPHQPESTATLTTATGRSTTVSSHLAKTSQ